MLKLWTKWIVKIEYKKGGKYQSPVYDKITIFYQSIKQVSLDQRTLIVHCKMKSILATFHSHRVDTNKPWQISVDWRQTSDTCVKIRLDPYRHNLIVKEAERTRCRISMIILRALNLRESPFSVLSPAFIRSCRYVCSRERASFRYA